MGAVERAASGLAGLTIEDLPEDDLDGLLVRLRRPIQQMEGVRARAAAASQARSLERAGGGARGPVVREHQRQLAEEQQLTPSEAKRRIDAGKAARDNAGTRRAMVEGRIGPGHAQRIAEVLAAAAPEQRDEVERELLELADGMDALAFSRAARRLLGRVRPEALARDERRKHLDRAFRATDTEDGGFAFSGLLYGAAAEEARVALNAFRRPDTPDEVRTPAQRGADAFQQLCAAALRIGDAPTQHGVRPHVAVVFTAEQYAALSRSPEMTMGLFAGSGHAASGRELRELTDDCRVFRVVVDAKGAPIEVSDTVRTVPIGLWRALVVRDGGCVWPGCDAPPSWCDVAHGNVAYTRDGRLSPDNALLLCRRHHRRFDHGPYKVQIDGDQVTIERVTCDDAASTVGPGLDPDGGPTGTAGPAPEQEPEPPERPPGGAAGGPPSEQLPDSTAGGPASERPPDDTAGRPPPERPPDGAGGRPSPDQPSGGGPARPPPEQPRLLDP